MRNNETDETRLVYSNEGLYKGLDSDLGPGLGLDMSFS